MKTGLSPQNSALFRTTASEPDAKSQDSLENSPKNSVFSNKTRVLPSSTRDSLFCEQMAFVSEKSWLQDDFCAVCQQFFNKIKGIFKHHCRACGCCCCGECSKKRINSERCCDLCYLRVKNADLIEKKTDILTLKDQLLQEMLGEIDGISLKIREIDEKIEEIAQAFKEDRGKQLQKMQDLRENLRETGESYREKLENYKSLRENMKKNRETLAAREKTLSESSKKLGNAKEDAFSKEALYRNKAAELAEYMRIFSKIKNCESFVHLKISVEDLSFLEIMRTNSKEHSFFLTNFEKKAKNAAFSRFSSRQNLSSSQQSVVKLESFANFSQKIDKTASFLRDYKENSVKISNFHSEIENIAEKQGNGCFCVQEKCTIF